MAAEYVVIAVTVVPRLAMLADEPGRLIRVATWGAAAFFLGCAATHVVIALDALGALDSGGGHDVHGGGTAAALVRHVVPHVAQLVGGATFIAIASRRLEIRVSRREVAARLRDLETRLATALDASDIGAWDVDLTTGEWWRSDRFDAIVGHDAGAAPWPAGLLARAHPDDRARVAAALEQRPDQGPFELECRFVRPDGEVRWVVVRGEQLADEAGAAARSVGTVVDVSERHAAEAARRALEDQLHQAQKMDAIGRLASGVAHDFNNLLAVMAMSAEVGIARAGDPAEAERQFTAIRMASRRAADLTRQLLLFGRASADELVRVDVDAVVAETAELLERRICEGVRVVVDLDGGGLEVRGDPTRLGQVVMNLALNARDAMPDGGTLTLRTRREAVAPGDERWGGDAPLGACARLEVADTGTGMDATTVERIFEPFFTTKPAGRGTGLGLSTADAIVRQMRGRIGVRSAPGAGTTFEVLLPLDTPEPAPGDGAPGATASRGA